MCYGWWNASPLLRYQLCRWEINVNLPRILKGRHISMTLNWYSFWWIIHPWSFDRIIQFNCNTWNKIIAGYWCMGTTPSKTKPTNSKIKNTMPKKTMTSFHQLFFLPKEGLSATKSNHHSHNNAVKLLSVTPPALLLQQLLFYQHCRCKIENVQCKLSSFNRFVRTSCAYQR